MDAALKVAGISKRYDKPILDSVSLHVLPGEVVSIIGPSGAGKTTLLRCISGLAQIDSGQIHLGEEAIITPASGKGGLSKILGRVGLVFQDFHLWPHMTVLENVAYAPWQLGISTKDAATVRASKLLEKFGLSSKAGAYPEDLSGGQKQRVAIARALAANPKVLLLDEITSSLDPELVGSIAAIVRGLAKEGISVLLVTHNMDFASGVSDRIVFLDNGRIVEEGSPLEIFGNPKHGRTKEFISASFEKI